MSSKNPIVVLGAGPAGMATALALHTAGKDVVVFERYKEARPAGNILNLWPPAIKALNLIGVDTVDLGAPCHSTFQNTKGKIRADVQLRPDVIRDYGGGFIGMLRPDLYSRMLEAVPKGMIKFGVDVKTFVDKGSHVELTLADGSHVETPILIGADGIDSIVREKLWGSSPKREHNLQIIGGYTLNVPKGTPMGECVVAHSNKVQGSYTAIRTKGKDGAQWWVLEGRDATLPPAEDLAARAAELAKPFTSGPLQALIAGTPKQNIQHWVIRDRVPLKKWSKGRVTIAGDAAHATSPYAAYGAGMSICDGYFIAQHLAKVDLADTAAVTAALVAYETPRIPHTTTQVQMAYQLGQMFHHAPAFLRPVRDFFFDNTKFLQKQIGERSPKEIQDQLAEMGESVLIPA